MDLCPLSFWTTTSDSPPGLWLDGGGQSATGSCTDNAGNTASVTASGIDIDQTAPTAAPRNRRSRFGQTVLDGLIDIAPRPLATMVGFPVTAGRLREPDREAGRSSRHRW